MTEDQKFDDLVRELQEFRRKADEVFGELDRRNDVTTAVIWRLLRATSLVERQLESDVHRPMGWSMTGFRIMYNTYVLGTVDPGQLARMIGTSAPSISSALATLERDRYIKRVRVASDRRNVKVKLTAKGRQAVIKAFPVHQKTQQLVLANLSEAECSQLASLLDKILTVSAVPEAASRQANGRQPVAE